MKILVVFDSFFGNTEQIAYAISDSFSTNDDVKVCRVNDFELEQLSGLHLLIAGSPTRGFKPSPAMKDFLTDLPANGLKGIKVASFDTRISPAEANSRVYSFLSKTFGFAAEPILKILVKKGGSMLVPPEGFFVKDSEGPLKEGELKRAAEWIKKALFKLQEK